MFLTDEHGNQKMLYHTPPTGYCVKDVDVTSGFNKVKVDGKEMSVGAFVASLRNLQGPTVYDELPMLSVEETKSICRQSTDKIILRKGRDNQSLVVARTVYDRQGMIRVVQKKNPQVKMVY